MLNLSVFCQVSNQEPKTMTIFYKNYCYFILPVLTMNKIFLMYEVCPKSIRPAFIPSRQSARAASAGYERNQ